MLLLKFKIGEHAVSAQLSNKFGHYCPPGIASFVLTFHKHSSLPLHFGRYKSSSPPTKEFHCLLNAIYVQEVVNSVCRQLCIEHNKLYRLDWKIGGNMYLLPNSFR